MSDHRTRRAPFVFYEPVDTFGDGMIARVQAGITSVDELYDVLTEALHLPGYFGRNWDALADVLRDLSWLAPRQIAIIHADLPDVPAEELRVYLDVLRMAVDDWVQRPGDHVLVVAFPEAEQLAIRRLLT